MELTLYYLAAALRGSPLAQSELPDLREDHHTLIYSGNSPAERYTLVNIETDRVTNSLNTLSGGWFTALHAQVVQFGSNGFDVFPSLHCAVILYLLLFDRQHQPWRFKLLLLPCAGLCFSTLYLRYHYFIDLPCGLALGAFSLWLANRYKI